MKNENEKNLGGQIILILILGLAIYLRGYITPPAIDYSKIPKEYHHMVNFAMSAGY